MFFFVFQNQIRQMAACDGPVEEPGLFFGGKL